MTRQHDELSTGMVKWLTYLVYIMLFILTILTSWHTVTLSALPDKYVRLERYTCDMQRIEKALSSIDTKLDRLIMGKRSIHE